MNKVLLFVTTAIMAGCAKLPVSLPTSGTNVLANTQIGKTTTQTIGTTQVTETKFQAPEVVETVEQVGSVVNTNVDPWVILLLIFFAGVLIPRPQEIGKMLWPGKK